MIGKFSKIRIDELAKKGYNVVNISKYAKPYLRSAIRMKIDAVKKSRIDTEKAGILFNSRNLKSSGM